MNLNLLAYQIEHSLIKSSWTPIVWLGSVIKHNQTHNKIWSIKQNRTFDFRRVDSLTQSNLWLLNSCLFHFYVWINTDNKWSNEKKNAKIFHHINFFSKSCNLISSESKRLFQSCPPTQAELLPASFTSLLIVDEPKLSILRWLNTV